MRLPSDLVAESLMAYLSEEDRAHVVGTGTPRVFGAGETLLRQGDPTDHVLVLVHGWARVLTRRADGQTVLVAFRGPGDVLGDLAALHGWVRSADVESLEEVHAVHLRAHEFGALLEDRPTVAIAMVKQLAARLREAENARAEFATMHVTERVAAYLLWLSHSYGVKTDAGVALRVPFTQQDIANRVGASLRAVARAFAVLRDRGIVINTRRQTVIARPDVLRAFVREVPEL
ncbi:Crp/Fnr family transcriptional regulator [Actinokineospora globicatena]|uniref:Crp/Fnr family transcriptional regulator n=1 Tax=Actinokineospora globicatena TaxID=103729 RepID=A0A9W6QQ50_9PSEU|nr:Crp/Fnr family transcriptional regulator [Actinokineospora globicatena]MCP2305028.1 cAMP-binding domain of CRP or a regulatory subunit of cAMP-dependent protein kinases [Actinokineospora globicatena]GLW80490.1 Crp/Fnr family transcriptional regulator [Actinokineospora globicatena]GLW87318.1 Crp/Fnr family transcriptional regulator [Actinokineospora globicatena]GLW93960.1 Crp/Fnr family transcriptional regulator [Actinokineospora globicatena]